MSTPDWKRKLQTLSDQFSLAELAIDLGCRSEEVRRMLYEAGYQPSDEQVIRIGEVYDEMREE